MGKIEKCSQQGTVNLAIVKEFFYFTAILADLFSMEVPNIF